MHRFLLAIALCSSPAALAQPAKPAPTAEAKKQAAEHFERGRTAYNFGNYDVAVTEYQTAFDLTGAPEYVFNIAQTYRTKGDKPQALTFYRKYIEIDPSGAGVASARAHIDALEKAIQAEHAAAEAKRKADIDAEARRQRDAEEAKQAAADTAKREAAEAAQRQVAEAEVEERKQSARTLRIVGISAGAAGVITLGIGAYFGLRAASLSDDASNTSGMWTDEATRQVEDAEAAERNMYIFVSIGSAVAITGAVLYVIGSRRGDAIRAESKPISVSPAPMRGGAGLVLGGHF